MAEESLSSIRTVQSFVKEEKEMGDYRRKIEYVLSLSFKESLAKGVFWSMVGGMDGWMDRWLVGGIDGWLVGGIDAWMDGWIVGSINGWMDG